METQSFIAKLVFFAPATLFILYEMMNLFNPKDFIRFSKKIKDKKGTEIELTDYEIVYGFFAIFYILWSFIGLLSSQWILFLVLIVFSLVLGKFKNIPFIRSVDALITILLLSFILINAFHLHLDLYKIFF